METKTSSSLKEKRIRLNHNCQICGNIIYIEDGTIIEGRPLHIKCYHDEVFLSGQKAEADRIKGIIEKFDKKIINKNFLPYDDWEALKKDLAQINTPKKDGI